MPEVGTPQWIYVSSLGEHSLPFHNEVISYMKSHQGIKLAFQPGTFQIRLGYEALKEMYQLTEIFFCNIEEAQQITKSNTRDPKELLQKIKDLGPRIVVITDGPRGAYAYEGVDMWYMPMYPDPKPPYERTGAGDAFASTFTTMLALGKTIQEALLYAPINSMSVVQKVGAQAGLLTLPEIEDWLTKAPPDYKVQNIS